LKNSSLLAVCAALTLGLDTSLAERHAQRLPSVTSTAEAVPFTDTLVRILAAPDTIGRILLPAGTMVWRSDSSKWIGGAVRDTVRIGNRLMPAHTLLAFDEHRRLRVALPPVRADYPSPNCAFFGSALEELDAPAYPPGDQPRQSFQLPFDPSGPLREPVDAILSSSVAQLGAIARADANDQRQGFVIGRRWELAKFTAEAGAVAMLDRGTPEVTTLLLLGGATLGDTRLPPGSCLATWANGPYYQLSTVTGEPLRIADRIIAARNVVLWGHESVRPATYILGEPLPVGRDILPSGTQVIELVPDVMVVRPPAPMTIGGVPIDASAFTIIAEDEVIETWLASSWTSTAGHVLPRDTWIQRNLQTGSVEGFLPSTTTLAGMRFAGHFISGAAAMSEATLASPATVGGVECEAGIIWFFADGRLRRCELAKPHIIAGIKLRAGTFEVTPRGRVVQGVLDQDLTLGTKVFHAGDLLNGSYPDTATVVIVDAREMANIERDVSQMMDTIIPQGLMSMKGGAGSGFGSYGLGQIRLVQARNSQEPHAFVSTRKYAIENFWTNWPFDDCDCRMTLVTALSWQVSHSWRQIVVDVGLKPGSKITIECNICPTTSFLLSKISMFGAHIPVQPKRVATTKFSGYLSDKQKRVFQVLAGTDETISVRVDDIVIENGQIAAKCSFQRLIQ
jgi:hypothetical protein